MRVEWRTALKRQIMSALREALLWIGKLGKEFDIIIKAEYYKDPSWDDKVWKWIRRSTFIHKLDFVGLLHLNATPSGPF